jgi:hypothetical protein
MIGEDGLRASAISPAYPGSTLPLQGRVLDVQNAPFRPRQARARRQPAMASARSTT